LIRKYLKLDQPVIEKKVNKQPIPFIPTWYHIKISMGPIPRPTNYQYMLDMKKREKELDT
jgi:hypothetical protein